MTALPETRCFPARYCHFDAVREFLRAACAGMDQTFLRRLELIVEELFCNSVEHGYGGESDQPVWLTLSAQRDICHLTYEDGAPAHNPFAQSTDPMLDADLQDRPIGGLGVFLLVELSTSHRYERRGERNVIELELPCICANES